MHNSRIQYSILSKLLIQNAVSMLLLVIAVVIFGWYSAKSTETKISAAMQPAIESAARFRMEAAALRVAQPLQNIFNNANALNRFLAKLTLEARSKALNGVPMRESVNQIVRMTAEATPSMLATYITAEIDAFDHADARYVADEASGSAKNGRYSPYWVRDAQGKVSFVQEDESVITDESPQVAHPTNWWYTCPKLSRKTCVVDPYLYEGVLMASVVLPIMDGQNYIGGAGADLSLDFLSNQIQEINQSIYEGRGRIYLISQDGVIAGDSQLKDLASSARQKLGTHFSTIDESIRSNRPYFSINQSLESAFVVLPFKIAEDAATWAVYMQMPLAVVLKEQKQINQLLEEHRDFTILGQIAVAAGIFIMAMLVAWTILSRIVKPLKTVATTVQRITETNDLTEHLPATSMDEIGALSEDFNSLLSKFRELIRQIQASSESVNYAASQSTLIAEENANHLSIQHAQVQQIVSAMHDISTTAEHIVDHAESAEHSAKDAEKSVIEGGRVVQSSSAKIMHLSEIIGLAIQEIEAMRAESQNISKIVHTINDIADQTNLLALNAAIEAARSGERGKGFAVVAGEVRDLSLRVQKSTHDISDMIKNLLSKTASTANVITSGQKHMAEVQHLSKNTETALSTIHHAVNQISDMNSFITQAAKDQSTLTGHLDRNLLTIASTIDHILKSVNEANQASRELNSQASNLNSRIKLFKS